MDEIGDVAASVGDDDNDCAFTPDKSYVSGVVGKSTLRLSSGFVSLPQVETHCASATGNSVTRPNTLLLHALWENCFFETAE